MPDEFAADGLDYLLNVPKYGKQQPDEEKRKKKKKEEAEERGPVKKQKKEKKIIAAAFVAKEVDEEKEEEDEEEQEEDDEEEEEEELDADAVLEALQKQKAAKKSARPATEIDQIFSALGGKNKKKTETKTKANKTDQQDGFAGRSMPGGLAFGVPHPPDMLALPAARLDGAPAPEPRIRP